jgi:hypothetical protein
MRAAATIALALGACAVQPPAPCPSCLSSQGLYADIATKQVVPGALAYTPAYEGWSDGADKQRWVILPEGTQVDTSDLDHWTFPIGTKLFKEFSLDGHRLETRVVETIADTGSAVPDHRFAAYVWRDDESDADLAPDSGVQHVLGTDHDVPSVIECTSCHQSERGAALGFSAVQLSGGNAAPTLPEVSSLLTVPPTTVFPIPGDPLQSAALGFLHANCGHCHTTENGICPNPLFRLHTGDATREVTATDSYTTTVDVPINPAGWSPHPADITMLVVPGDPDYSGVYFRASVRGTPDQMPPPYASKIVPEAGVAALRAWIATMPVTTTVPD